MAEPTPYSLSQLLSQLVGQDVRVAFAAGPPSGKARLLYGIYSRLPDQRALVVKADLAMLGVLAGALLGLPGDTAVERALETPMNEPIRDAIHEILNIASTALSTEGRVIFEKLVMDPVYCTGEANEVVRSPERTSRYVVSIDGETSGSFELLSRM